MKTVRWIETDGGPLVAMPRSLVCSWMGTEGDEGDSHYDSACSVADYLGILKIFETDVLVLGDEPLSTTVLSNKGRTVIVRWVYADAEGDILMALNNLQVPSKPDERVSVDISESLLMFGASCSGRELDSELESWVINIKPGGYEVVTARVEINANTCILVHWFVVR